MFDVFPRASARIHSVGRDERLEGRGVGVVVVGLVGGFAVPLNSEPTQVFDRLLGCPGFDARRVKVVDPQGQFAVATACGPIRDQVGSRVAEVLRPGGRWCEATATHCVNDSRY